MAAHGWINGMELFKYNYLRCGSSRRYYTQVNWPLFFVAGLCYNRVARSIIAHGTSIPKTLFKDQLLPVTCT